MSKIKIIGTLVIAIIVIFALINMNSNNYVPLSYCKYAKIGDRYLVDQDKELQFFNQAEDNSGINPSTSKKIYKGDTIVIKELKATYGGYIIKVASSKKELGWLDNMNAIGYTLDNGKEDLAIIKWIMSNTKASSSQFIIAFATSLIILILFFMYYKRLEHYYERKDTGEENLEKPSLQKILFIPILSGFLIGFIIVFYVNRLAYFIVHPNVDSWQSIMLLIAIVGFILSEIYIVWQSYKHFNTPSVKKYRSLVICFIGLSLFISSIIFTLLIIVLVVTLVIVFFFLNMIIKDFLSGNYANSGGGKSSTPCSICGCVNGHASGCERGHISKNGQMASSSSEFRDLRNQPYS